MTPDPIETTAAAVHDAWMDAKRSAGVTTRLAEDGEELMASYEDLSEKAKELDRATVRAVFHAAPTEALWQVVCQRLGVNPNSNPTTVPHVAGMDDPVDQHPGLYTTRQRFDRVDATLARIAESLAAHYSSSGHPGARYIVEGVS